MTNTNLQPLEGDANKGSCTHVALTLKKKTPHPPTNLRPTQLMVNKIKTSTKGWTLHWSPKRRAWVTLILNPFYTRGL